MAYIAGCVYLVVFSFSRYTCAAHATSLPAVLLIKKISTNLRIVLCFVGIS